MSGVVGEGPFEEVPASQVWRRQPREGPKVAEQAGGTNSRCEGPLKGCRSPATTVMSEGRGRSGRWVRACLVGP